MKELLNFIFSKKFLINLTIAIVAFCILGYVVLCLLDGYTSHGVEVAVPDVTLMQVDEANKLLAENDLSVEVIDSARIDAMIKLGAKPGDIVWQNPTAGFKIKKDRKIYVKINPATGEKTRITNEYSGQGLSLTATQNELKAVKLNYKVKYVPAEDDAVQDVVLGGRTLKKGDVLPVGTVVTIVVGKKDSIAVNNAIIDDFEFDVED